jgi:aminoglycoside 3-N-acetyltransferase
VSVPRPATRSELVADLRTLGVRPGAALMVHAGLKALGPVLGGVETVVAALRDALGPAGTLVAYAGFYDDYEAHLDGEGRCPAALRDQVPGFSPAASRANPDHGLLPEAVRTTPGALRSANDAPAGKWFAGRAHVATPGLAIGSGPAAFRSAGEGAVGLRHPVDGVVERRRRLRKAEADEVGDRILRVECGDRDRGDAMLVDQTLAE